CVLCADAAGWQGSGSAYRIFAGTGWTNTTADYFLNWGLGQTRFGAIQLPHVAAGMNAHIAWSNNASFIGPTTNADGSDAGGLQIGFGTANTLTRGASLAGDGLPSLKFPGGMDLFYSGSGSVAPRVLLSGSDPTTWNSIRELSRQANFVSSRGIA